MCLHSGFRILIVYRDSMNIYKKNKKSELLFYITQFQRLTHAPNPATSHCSTEKPKKNNNNNNTQFNKIILFGADNKSKI